MNGDVIATNVMWTAHSSTIVSGTTGVTIENGVLVINDATTFLGLGIPVVLQCTGNRRQAIYQAGKIQLSVLIIIIIIIMIITFLALNRLFCTVR